MRTDCAVAAPTGTNTVTLDKTGPTGMISWTPLAGAVVYQVVRGVIGTLVNTGGDFTVATKVCTQRANSATSVNAVGGPLSGQGFWYLVRGLNCGGPGTYDSGSPAQIATRDAKIESAAGGCP